LKIFQSAGSPIIILSTIGMPRKTQAALGEKAVLHLAESDDIDLAEILRILRRQYNVPTVACEGGPTLFRSLLERELVDQLNLTITSYLFGGAKAPTLTHCRLIQMRVVGKGCSSPTESTASGGPRTRSFFPTRPSH
jgi:riboflavin biosynthesis pyrimidine reductase